MDYIFLFLGLFLWLAFWSAQSGYSMKFLNNKLQDWQRKIPSGNRIPELVLALTIGSVGAWGWGRLFPDIPVLWGVALWAALSIISFGGKESATWGYLNWEGHTKDKDGDGVITDADGRDSTMFGFNNMIAKLFNFKLGDEGYSWVWAFTKGLITTLPVMSFGAIFQPLGREMASHAKGRLPGDSNFYMEFFGDGFGYAAACTLFILVVNLIGG